MTLHGREQPLGRTTGAVPALVWASMPHLLPALLLAVLEVLVLWPLPMWGSALGHPLSDMPDHLWGAWWWGGEILAGRLPSFTSITHLPAGSALWHVDPLGAMLALLLRPLGFPAAYDGMLFLAMWAGALSSYAMAWSLFRKRLSALVAGVAVGSAPYLLGLVHSGLSEYLGLALPTLFFWAMLRVVSGQGRPLWAGLALAACTLQSFYYGAFATLLGLCFLPGCKLRRRAPLVGRSLVLGVFLSLFIMYLAGETVSWGLDGSSAAVGMASAPGWQQASLPGIDLSLFLRPGQHYYPDTPALGNPGIIQVHYLGWVLLLLGLPGFFLHGRLRVAGLALLLYGIFALGPRTVWYGQSPTLGDSPVSMPLALLYWPSWSPWHMVHHPYRMVAFLLPMLAMGLAAATTRLPPWSRVVVALLVLAEGLLVSPAQWPLETTGVEAPAIYERLSAEGAVLDWPPDATDANRHYLLWQVSHGRSIAYGVNTFLPAELLGDPLVADLLWSLDSPLERSRNRDVPGHVTLVRPAAGSPLELGAMGFRYLVLHGSFLWDGERKAAVGVIQAWLGPPLARVGQDLAWEIPAPGP